MHILNTLFKFEDFDVYEVGPVKLEKVNELVLGSIHTQVDNSKPNQAFCCNHSHVDGKSWWVVLIFMVLGFASVAFMVPATLRLSQQSRHRLQ